MKKMRRDKKFVREQKIQGKKFIKQVVELAGLMDGFLDAVYEDYSDMKRSEL